MNNWHHILYSFILNLSSNHTLWMRNKHHKGYITKEQMELTISLITPLSRVWNGTMCLLPRTWRLTVKNWVWWSCEDRACWDYKMRFKSNIDFFKQWMCLNRLIHECAYSMLIFCPKFMLVWINYLWDDHFLFSLVFIKKIIKSKQV